MPPFSSDLLLRKNADYGDAWMVYGIAGVLIRSSDKTLRLQKLTSGQEALVVDENIKDTLADLVGYGLLGLLWLSNARREPTAKAGGLARAHKPDQTEA